MVKIIERLKEESKEIMVIEEMARKNLKKAPAGQIRIAKKQKRFEFYYKEKGEKGNGKYMGKEQYKLVEDIVQRDYDTKILKKAQERRKAIDSFIRAYGVTDLKNVYESMSECRKEMVKKYILSDEDYMKMWNNVVYQGKGFAADMPEIYTEKGERVRSKSEKIIADKLYMKGIPYRYEYPLVLEKGITWYPDFTILDAEGRREVYLEHFGMMDDAEYAGSAVNKINIYARNGICLGDNLFITCETAKAPLSVKTLDCMLDAIFDQSAKRK